MKYVNIKISIAGIGSLLFSVVSVMPTYAQISHTTPAEIKSETKRSKKEAASYEAEYKESHLQVENRKPKVGLGRKQVKPSEEPAVYTYDKEINAITEEVVPGSGKKKKKLFHKKKKD